MKRRERRGRLSHYLGRPEKKRNVREEQRHRREFHPRDFILIEEDEEDSEKKENSQSESVLWKNEGSIMIEEEIPPCQEPY